MPFAKVPAFGQLREPAHPHPLGQCPLAVAGQTHGGQVATVSAASRRGAHLVAEIDEQHGLQEADQSYADLRRQTAGTAQGVLLHTSASASPLGFPAPVWCVGGHPAPLPPRGRELT